MRSVPTWQMAPPFTDEARLSLRNALQTCFILRTWSWNRPLCFPTWHLLFSMFLWLLESRVITSFFFFFCLGFSFQNSSNAFSAIWMSLQLASWKWEGWKSAKTVCSGRWTWKSLEEVKGYLLVLGRFRLWLVHSHRLTISLSKFRIFFKKC